MCACVCVCVLFVDICELYGRVNCVNQFARVVATGAREEEEALEASPVEWMAGWQEEATGLQLDMHC